jgi:hypothetical protein
MPRTRRTYTPEFKAEAVKLVTEQGYSGANCSKAVILAYCRGFLPWSGCWATEAGRRPARRHLRQDLWQPTRADG